MIWGLFLEGLLSFFTPCVLPLVPLYIGYLTAEQKQTDDRRHDRIQTAVLTFFFVLGICTVFFIAGLGSGLLREFFTGHELFFLLGGGFVLLLFGLFSLGIIGIPLLQRERRIMRVQRRGGRYVNAYLLGFLFSFAWSPCVGPLLASAILAAAGASTKLLGWLYILAYSLGFIFMFILIGLFTEEVLALLKKHRNIVKYTQVLGGLAVLCMGGYMLYQAGGRILALEQNGMMETAAQNEPAAGEDDTVSEDGTDLQKYGFTLSNGEREVSISEYEGKTIVMNFFGTWCHYCNQFMPFLQNLSENREDVKVFLIAAPGYNGEGDEEYIQKYMTEHGYDMEILYDPDLRVSRTYGVSGYPTTFIIQPDGMFYEYYLPGYVAEDMLNQFIDEASAHIQ